MSDYYGYFDIDSSYNATTIDDDFIGGTSVILIGVASFVVVILIILAIHLFSKKLNEVQCDNGYQQFDNAAEEIEPLPEYEERETGPDGEVDLSDCIHTNTIDTIPRNTMNIINILSNNSQITVHSDNNNNNSNNNNNNNNEIIHSNSNNSSCSRASTTSENNQINNEMDIEEQLLAIPSTSTLPLPTPEKENMPCVPPPCYDVALTQPRINNQGMIVLPQDPSFAINLPSLLRSTNAHRHYMRRSRQRIKRFFSRHDTASLSNNNYHLPDQSSSVHSHTSNFSSNISNIDSNNNNINNDSNSNGNNNSSNNCANINISDNNRSPNINRRNSDHRSKSRSFMNHFRIKNSTKSSKKFRRNLLRHNNQTSDNASISSVSIYPTTMIDIPEDHYNIDGNICREIRSNRIPEIERGCTSTNTNIPGTNDISTNVHTLPMENNSNNDINNIDTNITEIHYQQTNSINVLNTTDSLVELSNYNPSLLHEGEIINFDSNSNNDKNDDSNSSNHTPSS